MRDWKATKEERKQFLQAIKELEEITTMESTEKQKKLASLKWLLIEEIKKRDVGVELTKELLNNEYKDVIKKVSKLQDCFETEEEKQRFFLEIINELGDKENGLIAT